MANTIKKYFVLSGGGCRGFAHLGIVKALQQKNIYPLEIAGTSAGSIAGAFLANGFTPDEIEEMFANKFHLNLFGWNIFKPGLISMRNIREFLEKNLRYTKFEDLPIPLYVTATNFLDGSQKIFHQGNIIDAVIAASSIPVLFSPVVIDGIPYVDGGLSNNLPIEPFGDRKSEVVSVYVNPIKAYNPKEGSLETMDRAIHLSFRPTVRRSAEGCFLFIEPSGLSDYGVFDIHRVSEIVDAGYSFTKELLSTISLSAPTP